MYYNLKLSGSIAVLDRNNTYEGRAARTDGFQVTPLNLELLIEAHLNLDSCSLSLPHSVGLKPISFSRFGY